MSEMTPRDQLPDELCWAEEGHASDIALTAIADGERAILPAAVVTHVERCPVCAGHLGHAALLSLHAADRLKDLTPGDRLSPPAERPVPIFAVALGMLVALLGALPTLLDLTSAPRDAGRALPLFGRGVAQLGRRLLEPGSTTSLVLVWSAALVLVAIAVCVVRLAPRKGEVSS